MERRFPYDTIDSNDLKIEIDSSPQTKVDFEGIAEKIRDVDKSHAEEMVLYFMLNCDDIWDSTSRENPLVSFPQFLSSDTSNRKSFYYNSLFNSFKGYLNLWAFGVSLRSENRDAKSCWYKGQEELAEFIKSWYKERTEL
ncbi:MAG: hypothetical protein ABIH72_02980 [archaeon]